MDSRSICRDFYSLLPAFLRLEELVIFSLTCKYHRDLATIHLEKYKKDLERYQENHRKYWLPNWELSSLLVDVPPAKLYILIPHNRVETFLSCLSKICNSDLTVLQDTCAKYLENDKNDQVDGCELLFLLVLDEVDIKIQISFQVTVRINRPYSSSYNLYNDTNVSHNFQIDEKNIANLDLLSKIAYLNHCSIIGALNVKSLVAERLSP